MTPIEPDTGSLRVFYALVPSPPLAQVLGALARSVARRAHGRPVPAENVHLTLAFIGAWPTERLPVLLGVGAALRGAAVRVTLDAQGAFRRAGIAWIGPSSAPARLLVLVRDLGAALSRAGVAVEERAFHPHLTLARHCRGPYPQGPVGPLAWDVGDVALLQSATRAEGARYLRLASWPLRPDA